MNPAESLKASRVVFLDELVATRQPMQQQMQQQPPLALPPTHGDTIRVLGTLVDYDVHRNRAMISWRQGAYRLKVDTTLLGAFVHERDALYQWIGEVDDASGDGEVEIGRVSSVSSVSTVTVYV